ncbi:MAG TPA: hypothetical protein VKE51_30260 [Vicinamibacterales bacterium]|nr:hypothetical protein [Vicinamibacterales bacterium]
MSGACSATAEGVRTVLGRLGITLSVGAALLAGIASAVGIWRPEIYARETASWAAQGVGQDVVTLFIVIPIAPDLTYLLLKPMRAPARWGSTSRS